MRCVRKNDINGKHRAIASFLLICFIAATLFLNAFVIIHANHEHDHNCDNGSCAMCLQINIAVSFLTQARMTIVVTLVTFLSLFIAITIHKSVFSRICFFSPVTLCVRLNN